MEGGAVSKETGLPVHQHWKMLLLLIVLTIFDTLLCSVLLFYYSDTYANYINQATGTMYIMMSTAHRRLYAAAQRAKREREEDGEFAGAGAGAGSALGGGGGLGDGGEPLLRAQAGAAAVGAAADKGKPPVPRRVLVLIGFMNGTGNFFQAIGQVHTSGKTQTLLALIGIPVVMLLSWLFLHKQPNAIALGAAALIVLGTVLSVLPSLTASGGGGDSGTGVVTYWYSVLIFFFGQLFFAVEKVLEEVCFRRYARLDVLRMFQWTMVVQTLLYFPYYTIQNIGAFGGLDLADLPYVLRDGILCTAGADALSANGNRPACTWRNPFLFFTYCAVDYCCYGMGLYVIKKGGANLVVLATAISLPLTNIAFSLPLGSVPGFGEKFEPLNVAALACAMVGFYVYEKYGDTKVLVKPVR